MDDNGGEWVQQTVEGNSFWYYYDSNGDMVTGWIKSDGYWYYCYGDGTMARDTMVHGYYVNADGKWTQDERSREIIDGNSNHFWYYIGRYGKAVTGWNKIGNNFHLYYFPDGSMARNDTIDGFHVDNDGNIDSGTGWLKDEYSGECYYFSDGEMTYNDTVGGYHLNSQGKMVTGTGWIHVDSWWYYLDDNEKVVTDWLYDKGNWYYLYPKGSMAKGWIQYKGKWYYLKSSGEMVTGWTKYGDSWYYLDEDGKMQTGWIKDKGCSYYLNDDGVMLHDTTVDGYYLDSSGKCEDDESGNSKGTSNADLIDENDDEISTNQENIWLPPTLYNYASDSEKYSISSQNILAYLSIQWFNAKTIEEQHKIERQLLYFRANIPSDDTITSKYEEGLNELLEPFGLAGQLVLNIGDNSEEALGYKIDKLNELEGDYIYNALTDDTVMGAGITRRLECVGRTPSKSSRTGREVIARMKAEGKIDVIKGKVMFQAGDGEWYELKYGDMAHKEDAVKWWNETGRRFWEKAPIVRKWMLDPENYYIEHYSINRSEGAKIGETYKPSLKPKVTPIE